MTATARAVPPEPPFQRLSALVAKDMEAVNTVIATRMASDNAPRIPEVTRHLVDAGGKRLRPILTIAAARLCGYAGDDHVKLAATVEFIHTATLFARSFQLMVECGSLRVLDILADASATIAEGEVLQLSTGGSLAVEEATYLRMIHGKTAALFAAATEVGGVIAKAPEDDVQALRAYGRDLGMAFQIVDDVLDYGGAAARLGKNVGDDFREGKMTLPVLIAVADAKAAADAEALAFWTRCIETPSKQTDGDLEEALRRLSQSGALDRATLRARDYVASARGSLDRFAPSPLRDALSDVAEFVVSRLS